MKRFRSFMIALLALFLILTNARALGNDELRAFGPRAVIGGR